MHFYAAVSQEKTAMILHWSVRCSYHVPSIMSIKWSSYLYFYSCGTNETLVK